MEQPVNYSINVGNPLDSFLKGVQQKNAMDAQQAALAQAQAQAAQQQQMQKDLNALAANPNPTAKDYASVATRYPQLADNFKKIWEPLDAEQKKNQVGLYTQVLGAVKSGSLDIAENLIQKQVEAYRNSGDERNAAASEAIIKVMRLNPKMAADTAALALSQAMGPEQFSKTYESLIKTPGEVNKTQADIRNIDSQIADRASRLSLDADKLQTETQLKLNELNQKQNPAVNLDTNATKLLNDSTVKAVSAGQDAKRMYALADKLVASNASTGFAASGAEAYKKLAGSQDAVSQLRAEYVRLRNSEVLAMLPPGSASDKDISFALEGFLPNTANTDQLASFLRGMAKIKTTEAALENAKSEWVNNVGNLGKARQDLEIDGVRVGAGTTFRDFTSKYVDKAAKQQQPSADISSRKYLSYAQGGN